MVAVKQNLIGINKMKIAKYFYMATAALAMAIALTLGACSEAEVENDGKQQGLMPVLFSAGNMDVAVTRASAAYMPQDSKFVCKMFFHAGPNDTDSTEFYSATNPLTVDVNMMTDHLKIENEYGNAVFLNNTFYWQNRKDHVFLALTDNNQLKADPTFTGDSIEFDLTRGDKDTIAQQPDPILAYEIAKPLGATSEANRVKLFFEHQFAQVQVNIMNSQEGSVDIKDASEVISVELLGVAQKAYVPFSILPNGKIQKPQAEEVDINTGNDSEYGSSFSMIARKVAIPGYLKTFEGIAFGTLQRIRVTWTEPGGTVTHKAIVNSVTKTTLESGKKYIYNIELRRSTIAQVIPQIVDWNTGKTYNTEGTIND